MRIDDTPSGTFRAVGPRSEVARPDARNGVPTEQSPVAPERPRRDTVEFSETARSLADGSGDVTPTRRALSAERRDAIRQRVLEGAYNQLDVVDQVARRLLRSGDL
ncbi:MAG: hypothetical protein MUF00_01110 [Gemmatimonadaceae bacterium]|jgi:hypothetical protein|nr:hypothetical protein [Gemmatimonadaceae bacterium]